MRAALCLLALAGALAGAACGAAERRGPGAAACARAGFSGGSSAADGVFFAVVPAGCATGRRRACAVGDGTSTLSRVVVPAGVAQACVAFNQFVGSGLNALPGVRAGECFGRAWVAAPPDLPARTRFSPRPCRARGERPPRGGAGGRPPSLPRARPGTEVVEGRVRDPHGRAPETGAVGRDRTPHPPPWAVLTWAAVDGSACYAPGQVVDAATGGRADQLPGLRPTGDGPTATLVGSLRFDSRSGTGIQLYGLGRFAPVPVAEGGACGQPSAGAGLLVSWEVRPPRRDATLGHTLVAGVAGPRVRAVAVAGRELALGERRRSFLVVATARTAPAALPVEVTYDDGRRRRLAAR